MKRSPLLLLALALLAMQPPAFAEEKEEGFKSIFNGKDLTDWDGDPKFWTVQDGAITGITTKETPTNGNTFIVWTGGETGDFELKFEYKIANGNSGMQYRSFSSNKNDKWRIGGYQADFEAGDTYSGILYGEGFRGMLANRGQKTELVVVDGKFQSKEVGKVGDSKEIQKKIKKDDWNEYHIVAKGFTFKHYINGVATIECEDKDEKTRRASGVLALQLHAGPPMKVQARNIRIKGDTTKKAALGAPIDEAVKAKLAEASGQLTSALVARDSALSATRAALAVDPAKPQAAAGAKKKVVLVAGNASHGFGAHDHKAGCHLLAKQLNESGLGLECVVTYPGWPKDMSIFDGAAAIVIYSDGGGGHPILRGLKEVKPLMDKGVGLGLIHYAVEIPRGSGGEALLEYTGGYFETKWSVNPHWTIKDPKLNDKHPIAFGVKPFSANDEWYYHMRFREKMEGVEPILTAMPPAETITGRWKPGQEDGGHNGNQHVYKAVIEEKKPQHLMWARQRPATDGGGRGFGFTGGHVHWNWGNDSHRQLVLNGIAWIAKAEVPKTGVPNKTPTVDELLENHDEPVPANFDKAGLQKKIDEANGRKTSAAPANAGSAASVASNVKPAFTSKVVDAGMVGHAVDVTADITAAKQLYLVVTDAGDGFGCDWAAWIEPRLIDKDGKETKLTEMKWKSAESGHGDVNINKNSAGHPQRVSGKEVAFGIGAHANSVIAYDLPAGHGFVKFAAQGGLDEGGIKQGCGSTVQFYVYTSNPGNVFAGAGTGAKPGQPKPADNSAIRQPENAVSGLEVHEALQVELFAAEPLLMNPSNIDIDHKGRIWVAEIVNYRGHKGKRPEGDRIIILEDKDEDGKVDGEGKVFYQAPDFNSPHGVTVFATPSGKNTRVIVAIGDKIITLIDEDGDDKADKVEPLFTGIAGTQHDHGIHQVMFGPDGKLYFNFGNSGNQIKDKNGKQIVDKAGNEVKAGRKPYQEGMVFRCNMDGSEFETLGWNFRNNWMNTVDSFGTSWQSDNDDDGNKGVRINFVMEFGNYGYKDEITGAGWNQKRTNLEKDVPSRHWHLNDPGVVPTLLITGQGSPTGITMYEATLLPKEFHGQMIHCDAGPNVVRAYPVKKDGAGYTATTLPVVTGTKDKWFRPSDVKVAPDGSLIIADWYDPGVGGHAAGDLNRGRLFRVTPKGHAGYKVPAYKFDTIENCIEALKSPTPSVRYVAWTTLNEQGAKAEAALKKLWASDEPYLRARALWLLGKIEGKGQDYVAAAIKDKDADIRITGLRLARQLPSVDVLGVVASLAKDQDPAVRRECAVAIRHTKTDAAAALWADLATQYDGKDRWYLEALGLASDLHPDACFAAYEKRFKKDEVATGAAHRDIIWRTRAKACLPLLVKIITDKETKEDDKPRYLRAFDFHPKSPEKDKALAELLAE